MNPITHVYEKIQISIYEKLVSATEAPGGAAAKYYKEQLLMVKQQLLYLFVSILSEFLKLDSFDSDETGVMYYKNHQFEYSFSGLFGFIKHTKNFEGEELRMRNLGLLSILAIVLCIFGMLTYVGVETVSIVTNFVEQANAQSNLILK